MSEARSGGFALPGWIQPGDVARWQDHGRHQFAFDAVPGRYIVLGFAPDWQAPGARQALATLQGLAGLVDSGKAAFLAVANAPAAGAARGAGAFPAIAWLHDPERAMNRAYGAGPAGLWVVLNPMLRVIAAFDPRPDGAEVALLARLLENLPPPGRFLGAEIAAPVLVLSDVFEPELCRHLIALFEAHGGRASGFMQEIGGRTVEMHDPAWKRRSDHIITEPGLVAALRERLGRRVAPEIRKAFAFQATRIERELVACYHAEEGGHFGPHRDDTVAATAHRRFAVSINLNEDFEGGLLAFPEFSPRGIKAPAGAAVVFSCGLLHMVGRVTAGRRYAFLPFLFDEPAERLRQELAGPAAAA